MQDFKAYLKKYFPLKDNEWETIAACVQMATLNKGEYFLPYNKINRRLGWVIKGVFRYCYLDDSGLEITKYFVSEQQFISAIDSFISQSPSQEAIQALTDAHCYTLSYESYQQLNDSLPVWPKLVQAITAHSYNEKVRRISPMVVLDAKTRYRQFLASNPGLVNRISLGHLASYLGVTQQSLSRLRRELAIA